MGSKIITKAFGIDDITCLKGPRRWEEVNVGQSHVFITELAGASAVGWGFCRRWERFMKRRGHYCSQRRQAVQNTKKSWQRKRMAQRHAWKTGLRRAGWGACCFWFAFRGLRTRGLSCGKRVWDLRRWQAVRKRKVRFDEAALHI